MNSKGQESAVFEFLVVAIMGLAILLIVLNIVDYFSGLRFQASWESFKGGLKSAVNSPNGDVIFAKNISLNTGTITTTSLSSMSGIPSDCFEINSASLSAFKLSDDKTSVSISKIVETTVYFRCVLGSEYGSGTSCEESCLVSFGEEIQAAASTPA